MRQNIRNIFLVARGEYVRWLMNPRMVMVLVILFSDSGREYTLLYQADGEGKLDRRGDAVPGFQRTHLLCRVHNCDDCTDDPGFLFREWMEYPGHRLR